MNFEEVMQIIFGFPWFNELICLYSNYFQFLDCLSVFSEHAPRDLKIFYAFKIYDYDGDDVSRLDFRTAKTNVFFF